MLPIPIETLWSTPITRIQAEQLYVMQFRFFLRPNVPLLHVFFFLFCCCFCCFRSHCSFPGKIWQATPARRRPRVFDVDGRGPEAQRPAIGIFGRG